MRGHARPTGSADRAKRSARLTLSTGNVGPVDLQCRIFDVGGMAVLGVSGDLDLGTLPAFQTAVARLLADHLGATVAIDLDGVTVLDDAGLGVLLGAAGRARDHGGDLMIVCTTARWLERFTRSRLDRAIDIRSQLV